jgi:hypothetical protein
MARTSIRRFAFYWWKCEKPLDGLEDTGIEDNTTLGVRNR